jgi:hypothetical protein
MFLLPVLGALGTLAGLAAFYYFVWSPWAGPIDSRSQVESVADRLSLARKLLQAGSFRLAARELDRGGLDSLDIRERRRWQQLQREASVLADLVAEPIEDIVRHAAGVSEAEWQADFPRRYLGKSVLFDMHVRWENDRLKTDYVPAGLNPFRLELATVELFRAKNAALRRVIFGARLAGVVLEPPGRVWAVHFQPDSGVLLTDARAAELCCPAWGEADGVRLLEEQRRLTE